MTDGPMLANSWTWAASMGAVGNVLMLGIGGGGVWTISKSIALLVRTYMEKAAREDAVDTARADAVRAELMKIVDHQTSRIDNLESILRGERETHAREMAEVRAQHAEEVRNFRIEIDSMRRIIIQWQVSTGRVIDLPPTTTPKADEAMNRLIEQIDKVDEK